MQKQDVHTARDGKKQKTAIKILKQAPISIIPDHDYIVQLLGMKI